MAVFINCVALWTVEVNDRTSYTSVQAVLYFFVGCFFLWVCLFFFCPNARRRKRESQLMNSVKALKRFLVDCEKKASAVNTFSAAVSAADCAAKQCDLGPSHFHDFSF